MDILQYRTGPEAPWVGIPALKGDPGISVKSISINNNNHIVITLDDDSTIVSTNAIPIEGNGINILIVEELPTTGVEKTIYMVLRTEAYLNDYYDEYMWINNKWEIIGSTRLDLSNYYTKSEVNDAITNAVTAANSNYTAGSGINIDSNGVISANVAAADIEYDNTNSHMQATDIQSAIDYLATNSGSGGSDLPTDPAADGSYKLINTVGTNGGLSWEVDTAVPTKTSDLTNDSGFITSVPLATANVVGAVKPDGTTITIDNNGTISAQGGSSLPSDPTVDGSYKLVNTVATEGGVQTATQTWEEDSGGGSSYTAGSGIEIDENNQISQANLLHNPNGFLIKSFYDNRQTIDPYIHLYSNRATQEQIQQVGEWLLTYGFCNGYMGNPKTYSNTAFVTDFLQPIASYINSKISGEGYSCSTTKFAYADQQDDLNGQRISTYYNSDQYIYNSMPSRPDAFCLRLVRGEDTSFYIVYHSSGLKQVVPYQINYMPRPFKNARYTPFTTMRQLLNDSSGSYFSKNYSLGDVIDIMFQRNIFANLMNTDTAPTINNTINWVYA